jgi:hypothetical protein
MQLSEFTSRDHWLARAPGLHIGDVGIVARDFPPEPNTVADFRKRLVTEGYFQAHTDWGLDLGLLAGTVRAFAADNISPVFCFLYDEFWAPFHALAPLHNALLGDYALLPDFWIWHVDPKKGETGWKPHRDRGSRSLLPDGSPKSLTTWIALSRASQHNSCMHVVPANADPIYNTPRENHINMRAAQAAARVLPAKPGDFFMWNQAVLHWGGPSTPVGRESRVSMAFEFQRLDVPPFNQPLLKSGVTPSFEARLKLVAKQMLQYRHMYQIDPTLERMALGLAAMAS